MKHVCSVHPIRFTQAPPQLRFGGSLGLTKCGSWSATLLKWSATRATFGKHCISDIIMFAGNIKYPIIIIYKSKLTETDSCDSSAVMSACLSWVYTGLSGSQSSVGCNPLVCICMGSVSRVSRIVAGTGSDFCWRLTTFSICSVAWLSILRSRSGG